MIKEYICLTRTYSRKTSVLDIGNRTGQDFLYGSVSGRMLEGISYFPKEKSGVRLEAIQYSSSR